ncbi:uncharacterized protein KY384_002535 [Bacidia gigantensis]|uniref:uncharacterized protein n=1 Tax=Bacidia gigantensis TaxID=2732470 RepID=UPI001D0474E9|nr:uncharacterized protein KY384_002535 [Bacidia gigantensis]KAG8532658.1 hypothetical protein KY384_002535 [Bacidia gigantensis]
MALEDVHTDVNREIDLALVVATSPPMRSVLILKLYCLADILLQGFEMGLAPLPFLKSIRDGQFIESINTPPITAMKELSEAFQEELRGLIKLLPMFPESRYCVLVTFERTIWSLKGTPSRCGRFNENDFVNYMNSFKSVALEVLQERDEILERQDKYRRYIYDGTEDFEQRGLSQLKAGERLPATLFTRMRQHWFSPIRLATWKTWLRFWTDDPEDQEFIERIRRVEPYLPAVFWSMGPELARLRKPAVGLTDCVLI